MEVLLQIGALTRRPLAWLSGLAGLLAYNWWVLVPFSRGLMRSPNELFSNLEVTGQPYAIVMQRADVAAGVLLLLAFLLAGSRNLPGAKREWLGLVVFALAGAIGGLFPQVCADGLNHACLSAEWHFRLAASQYVHDSAGVVEFAAITLALLLAIRRTRASKTAAARCYRFLGLTVLVAYPVLGVSYLFNVDGGVVEGVFFAAFTTIVLLQLAERLHRDSRLRGVQLAGLRARPPQRAAAASDSASDRGRHLESWTTLGVDVRGEVTAREVAAAGDGLDQAADDGPRVVRVADVVQDAKWNAGVDPG